MPKAPAKGKFSPAAMVTRGALKAYIQPRLAQDAQPNCMTMIDRSIQGLTSKNFATSQKTIVSNLRRLTTGRLAMDIDITGLAALLSALKPEAESADADQAPGLGQIASNPGGSAGPGMVQEGESEDVVAKIKAYLEEEGVAPEILNNLDAFLAEHQPTNMPNGQGGNGPPNGGAMANVQQPNIAQPDPNGGDQGGTAMAAGAQGAAGGGTPLISGLDEDILERGSPEDLEPRGTNDPNFVPESSGAADAVIPSRQAGQDQDMQGKDQVPPQFRDDDDDDETMDEEAEDELVPSEQDEQLDGVSKVSSEGVSSRVVNGGANDRAITKKAMDRAIKLAQDAAISNQRSIYRAAQYCSQWIGQNNLAMDSNSAADVYRSTLKSLGVRGIDKVHPDALKPILDAQPKPSARMARDQQQRRTTLAQDSKVEGSFFDRFPEANKITLQ
jgi:hypothetical protein